MKIVKLTMMILMIVGCQKAPTVASSADPRSVNAAAPMESETSNAELEKRLAVLNRLLDGQISNEEFEAAKAKGSPEAERLAKIMENLGFDKPMPEVPVGSLERDFAIGQFYFYERRFIEASHIFSKLLDKRPSWLRVRNLLARCFYFLGNTDRTYMELQFVLANNGGQAEEVLDALFLMGAIPLDSPSATPEQIDKGIGAFETYLKLAPNSPMREKIKDGLAEFAERKKAKNAHADTGDAKKDALLAIEGADMLAAENKIRDALKKHPRDDDLKVALARVFVKTGRVNEALAEFADAIKKNARNAVAYHYQGMAFMMSGNPKGAVESWQKVLEIDPKYGERFNLKGRIAIAENLMKKEKP